MFNPNLHACIALAEHALSLYVKTTISMDSGQFLFECRQHYFRCSETRTEDVEISLEMICLNGGAIELLRILCGKLSIGLLGKRDCLYLNKTRLQLTFGRFLTCFRG